MTRASHLTLHLARFDKLRTVDATLDSRDLPGVLFTCLGADSRAAATDPPTRDAYTHVMMGLHAGEDAAQRLFEAVPARAPWFTEARETWAGLLQPYFHKGEANFLEPAAPGAIFAPLACKPPAGTPVVAVTSVGWNLEGLDMKRVLRFGVSSAGVRASMTNVPGLRAQHSFFVDGGLAKDVFTVSFWRDEASLLGYAYGPGVHRDQIAVNRDLNLSDRTSFTRLLVLRQRGTWFARDPVRAREASV